MGMFATDEDRARVDRISRKHAVYTWKVRVETYADTVLEYRAKGSTMLEVLQRHPGAIEIKRMKRP